ncbi:hypothetical protein [Rhizobium leguminosarum]|uniref:hypothetical protein n=1 Tax=Rhizobium leguminosarum TaxID=384 RepID=UPI001030952A|nr:hypothetical protein [Rhizobium leguminosarum]TAY98668.1 hypothetical protein ELH79_09430 [Rhizobium leguminosarum]TAZ09433.1 hypothetical protein ELH78_09430 [Rhizobium leguminosarum]
MFGLQLSQILGFSVVGAIVTTLGSLLALYLKDVLAVRSLERWKARQTLISVYRRYRLPIYLAAEELSGRLYRLSRPDSAPRGVGVALLSKEIARDPNAMAGDHYHQYRFVSNVYRLCGFLGWVELYRRDIGTLDVDSIDRNHLLESCLDNVRSVIADGWINQHPDVENWRDCLIFREELRAIGSRMADGQNDLSLIDFGSFLEVLQKNPDGKGEARWFYQAALFFDDLQQNKDFRIIRMRLLVVFLTDLMEVLEPKRLTRSYIRSALGSFDEIDQITGGTSWRVRGGDMDAVRKRLTSALKH